MVKVTFKTGEVIEGTIIDKTADGRFVTIVTEIDVYNVDTTIVTIEEVTERPIVETVHHMTIKEAKTEMKSLLKQSWSELEETYVTIFNYLDGQAEGFDVEIVLSYEDGEKEFICTDTFGTEKEAVRRAKYIIKNLQCEYKGIYTV